MPNFSPKDLVNSPDVLSKFAEGKTTQLTNYTSIPVPQTTFRRMVVLDVISDPTNIVDYNDKKRDYWVKVLGVSNAQYISVLPRNTIIGKFAGSELRPLFVFPFFPSHLAMPCKPGETVWCMIENPEESNIDIAYWVCRITEPHNADDVNHTHAPRSYDPSFSGIDGASKRDRSKNDGYTKPFYELRNGDVTIKNGIRQTDESRALIRGIKKEGVEVFESLVLRSDAAQLMQYESVPRFKKRPGDIVLEGSNNSLIVLGTDRNSIAGNLRESPDNNGDGYIPFIPETDLKGGDTGSIDLVVGRGQSSATGGKQVSTTSILGARNGEPGPEIKKELGKAEDQIEPFEGDFDLKNDRSRIQISQRTKVDKNFHLDVFNDVEFEVKDSEDGDAAIVMKTDKIRLIARSDVEIIVTGFREAANTTGRTIKDENDQIENDDQFAAMIIKSNGDIIFKPSETGYIKLGDDNADRAILCTDTPAVLLQTSVSPATPALSNTMGGRFGGTGIPTQGTWASKVLVTGANAAFGGEIG